MVPLSEALATTGFTGAVTSLVLLLEAFVFMGDPSAGTFITSPLEPKPAPPEVPEARTVAGVSTTVEPEPPPPEVPEARTVAEVSTPVEPEPAPPEVLEVFF